MRRKGLTILEIILSVAIVAVSAVIIIRVFISAQTLNDKTKLHDEAVFELVNIMELMSSEEMVSIFQSYDLLEEKQFSAGFTYRYDGGLAEGQKVMPSGLQIRLQLVREAEGVSIELSAQNGNKEIYRLEKKMYRRNPK